MTYFSEVASMALPIYPATHTRRLMQQTGMERRRGLNVVLMESQFGLFRLKKRSIPSRAAAQ